MSLNKDKANILSKLLRGEYIGGRYDRLEHLKRFNKKAIKELLKEELLITKRGKKFIPISVNPKKLKEAVEFVEKYIPKFKDIKLLI